MSEQAFEWGGTDVCVDRLVDELSTDGDVGGNGEADSPETVLQSVLEDVAPGTDFEFDQEVVKQNLEEILLMLISLRTHGTHGKGLMEDLIDLFDSDLSPGTVYPRLHDLDDAGLLQVQEMVRTKEYHIEDEAASRESMTDTMYQHLALGLLLYRGLTEP